MCYLDHDLKRLCSTHSDLLERALICVFFLTLRLPVLSLTSGACDPLGILDAICRMKASERVVGGTRTAFSVPSSQPSELGYLNLTSPSFPPEPKDPEDGLGVADEQV